MEKKKKKKKHMTSCDWWNIKWNTKCGTYDLYYEKHSLQQEWSEEVEELNVKEK